MKNLGRKTQMFVGWLSAVGVSSIVALIGLFSLGNGGLGLF